MNTNKNIITNEYLIHTQQKPEGTSDAGSISNFDRNYFGLTLDLNGQHKYRYKDVFSLISTAGFSSLALMTTSRYIMEQTYAMVPR